MSNQLRGIDAIGWVGAGGSESKYILAIFKSAAIIMNMPLRVIPQGTA